MTDDDRNQPNLLKSRAHLGVCVTLGAADNGDVDADDTFMGTKDVNLDLDLAGYPGRSRWPRGTCVSSIVIAAGSH